MKTLTKNTKKTTKRTPKSSTPDRLAAFKALADVRLKALRVALKRVNDAERRLNKICDGLDSLQARCFDGTISPVETANEISVLMENSSDAWGTLEDAKFALTDECAMTVNDFTNSTTN
jgi:hypothetical protein